MRARIENIYAHRGFASIDGADLRGRFRWLGPLHPAQARARRRQDRRARAGGARRRVLHDAGPHRRRPAHHRAAARDRRDLHDLRPRHRRRHRPAERPVPLDPHRGRPRHLGSARGGRPGHHGGLRRLAARRPRLPRRRHRRRRDHRRHRRRSTRSSAATSATRSTPTCRASSRPSITGHPSQDVAPEVNDVSFVGTTHPEHGPGFDLWVGGGLSTNPMLAQKLGVWIPLDEVADVWEGVISIFRDYGYRRLRSRARLKFLVQDWGVEKFREVLEDEVPPPRSWSTATPRRCPPVRATTSASRRRRTAASTSASRRPSAGSTARR